MEILQTLGGLKQINGERRAGTISCTNAELLALSGCTAQAGAGAAAFREGLDGLIDFTDNDHCSQIKGSKKRQH